MPAFDDKDLTENVQITRDDKPVRVIFMRTEGLAHPAVAVVFARTVDGVTEEVTKALPNAQAENAWGSATTRTIKAHLSLLIDAVRAV